MSTVRRLTRARAAAGVSGQRLLSDKSSYSDLVHRPPVPAASADSTAAPTPSCPHQDTARSQYIEPGVPSGLESRIQNTNDLFKKKLSLQSNPEYHQI